MADTFIKKSPEQKLAEASEGMADYRAKEAATRANMLRLRAERLARESTSAPDIKVEPMKRKARRKIIHKY